MIEVSDRIDARSRLETVIPEKTRVARQPSAGLASTRRVLNTGSGPSTPRRLHAAFSSGWTEVRLDIDAAVNPDIVGTIRDMRTSVPDRSFQAVWSSHNVEHLHSYEVHSALLEFRRVLSDDGFVFLTCPDLEAIAELILTRGLAATAYQSPAGPITALDMLYGHIRSIAAGNKFMCHNTGFTQETLGRAAVDAGFSEAHVAKGGGFDLWAIFLMPRADKQMISGLLHATPEAFILEGNSA